MRVEQQCEHGETSADPSQILIHQLREITAIQDLQILQAALKTSHGDMGQAIALLTTPPEEGAVSEEGKEGIWVTQKKVMDMTPDGDKDDLQTAIELSLQESQNAEAEEQELNRALEVSAEENAVQMKRRRCEVLGESSRPADWIRQEGCPVGMRNVGNTCWFSAVIQSLFHLPVFRRLVLNYCLSESVLEKCKNHSEKRNIAFMQELRCLFALMVGSTRRFVDPSAAVELLKDAFRTSEAQQDVSEFTHKLLDWLEDAFQLAANGNNPDDKQENPMVQLFYGTFVAERTHEGKTFSNIEQFGQYPLQVNGFNNLDECLEGAMVEGEIEALHSDQTVSSGRERWFSKLPPVLTFELSRFEFNQSLGRPEKIHKKLEFPQIIYMDRYLHKNIEQTQGRREEVKRLKEQLTALQQKLESYKNYGSGPAKYPLADMLQYVLEFATTKPTSVSPAEDLRTVLSPAPASPDTLQHTDPTHQGSSLSEPADAGPSSGSGCQQHTAQKTPIYKPFTQCRPPMDPPAYPAPHSITEEELHFVKGCLQRWRTEVESNINELKSNIERVSQTLESMYAEGTLCQVPYRLHAVLVHEGQASAGHYWAYIFDHSHRRWLKYNDISVTESSWEELERDSYGGMTNASAYCLMYIDDKLPHLITDIDDETGHVLQGLDSLPPILQRYVREDNRWFQQELQEWEEQFCRAPQEEPAAPPTENTRDPAPAPALEPEPEEPAPSQPEPCSLPSHQVGVDREQTAQVIVDISNCPQSNVAQEVPSQIPQVEAETEPEPEAKGEVEEVEVEVEVEVQVEARGGDNEVGPRQKTEPEPEPEAVDTPPEASDTPLKASDTPPEASDTPPAASNMPHEASDTPLEAPDMSPEASETPPEALDMPPESSDTPAEDSDIPVEALDTPTEIRNRQPESQVSEVEIPNVGKILVRSDADGYNEEMMLTPAMQGIIMAIAKARQAFDKEGPEAGLIKVSVTAFHEEYSRLYQLSQEETTPQQDPRLQHVLVYFFQNHAPNRVIERTLLEQFADRNLSYDDRSISIMREARAKLRLIKPEDMDMEEYMKWHEDYGLFRTVFLYVLTGLEQYQNGKVREALNYLAYAYQNNMELLKTGEKKGVDQSLIALYRRKCLTELNENAATLFKSGEESDVEEGVSIMNDTVIPCMHLMIQDDVSQDDLDAIEVMRSRWCSYLGQDMGDVLQEKLGEFLPRMLDCSAEMIVLKEPPKVRPNSPHDLCSRLAAVMESIHDTSILTVK
ncbi:ubiquitin carboxyl-terminal hydrolase 28 isoform X2 [Megalops cyprinoides]|uniref:ubiquitin carboxyl-terminal hydrolase 28 isoform X2 n=1 Tax=Megalops cyprinoides TaxID=118141 RepID=UPI001864689D|nr:ubiquitin carboxyl-terminal hydrolase 28 isoform X2 [Megalops cyprinoides]